MQEQPVCYHCGGECEGDMEYIEIPGVGADLFDICPECAQD